MMDLDHVSPSVYLRMQDNRTIVFSRISYEDDYVMPTPDKCKGKITGVRLDYAACGEQCYGIQGLLTAFGASYSHTTLTKIPKELTVIENCGVKALKFGDRMELDSKTVNLTNRVGLIGYWEYDQFMIAASKDYAFIIDSIRNMFVKNKVQFRKMTCFGGMHFMILTI